jgi:predicted amidohydrolase
LSVAIGKIRMEWSDQANTQSMLRAMTQAAEAGAPLRVFPELALTGFHRRIRAESTPDAVRGG